MEAMSPWVRAASESDIPLLADLYACAFEEPWAEAAIRDLLAMPGAWALLSGFLRDGKPVPAGFAIARVAADEAELITIGVAPSLSRRGAARALMAKTVVQAAALGATALFLEVATDNAAARALYDSLGFQKVSLRRDYYRRAGGQFADALILRMPLAMNSPAHEGDTPRIP